MCFNVFRKEAEILQAIGAVARVTNIGVAEKIHSYQMNVYQKTEDNL